MDDTFNSSILSDFSNLSLSSSSSDDSHFEEWLAWENTPIDDFCVAVTSDPERSKRSYEFRDRRIIRASSKMSDSLFRSHFRVSKGKTFKYKQPRMTRGILSGTFELLMKEIRPYMEGPGSTNGKSLMPEEKVLLFLFFLAGNSLYRIKSYAHDIGIGTIVTAIKACTDIFYDNLVPKFIRLPTEEQARHECELFHATSGFPKIIWAAIGNCKLLSMFYQDHCVFLSIGSTLAAYFLFQLDALLDHVAYAHGVDPGSMFSATT